LMENVATLKSILQRAGFVVRIGSLIPELTTAQEVSLPNGQSLLLEPIQRRGNRLTLGDYDPCAILLNNDLSSGIPTLLKGLSQTLVPPPWAGWNSRRKSRHFSAYQQVATEFSRLIDIDPSLTCNAL
jgi:glutamate--cysteine ligase